MVQSKKLWAVVLGAMLTLAGCGDGDGGGGGNDNYTYTGRTVVIGGLTWMAENLNRNTSNSWCYDGATSNCSKYGRLYTWDAAMNACPAGWRVPSRDEWKGLVDAVSGVATELKSSAPGWDGTDDLGFSALPGGVRYGSSGSFASAGEMGYWWISTEDDPIGAWNRSMLSGNPIANENWHGKGNGLSVRCVKN